ncbi:Detected protein of unknown function [Hibiscus syriacus]|uniref:C2H2-type domain-containing protein n=1 Tax=Hibiscus syriacus TaxID=106335 RepID=A0A6A2XUQ5_HIBSY|nr:uncharacterized protein LOC120170399 [Hibiscus syriacus]KAE8673640.1 Detected protein of unknown function [Hibiscus syriacus]
MDDQVTNIIGEESVSIETALKPNKLMLKLKISEKISHGGGGSHHICSVCNKGFTSGKALGGHIRIHMKGNKASCHRKISKRQPRSNHRAKSKKTISNMKASPDGDRNQDSNEKVSCCICNKDFKSMKSLFGHMRNHPERNWRGIRPPPSDKNSCCSSVSENDEAHVVDQVKGSVSDILKSLPNWKTNTFKRDSDHGDDDDEEIPEAAYCLMKLSRGDSFDFDRFKTPLKLEEEQVDEKPSVYPKNPSGEQLLTNSKVCSSKTLLDFDLNEPYVEEIDGEA